MKIFSLKRSIFPGGTALFSQCFELTEMAVLLIMAKSSNILMVLCPQAQAPFKSADGNMSVIIKENS